MRHKNSLQNINLSTILKIDSNVEKIDIFTLQNSLRNINISNILKIDSNVEKIDIFTMKIQCEMSIFCQFENVKKQRQIVEKIDIISLKIHCVISIFFAILYRDKIQTIKKKKQI